ncbi:hypothetical protein D9599_07270 [Roseomonas sp. KE2513]|nr:hypothetical protein [Roseomonas sp. KE2513]
MASATIRPRQCSTTVRSSVRACRQASAAPAQSLNPAMRRACPTRGPALSGSSATILAAMPSSAALSSPADCATRSRVRHSAATPGWTAMARSSMATAAAVWLRASRASAIRTAAAMELLHIPSARSSVARAAAVLPARWASVATSVREKAVSGQSAACCSRTARRETGPSARLRRASRSSSAAARSPGETAR